VPLISEIAAELNRRSEGRPIGRLQQLRRELHGRERVPTNQLFDSRTISDEYAFHVGGRTELQFNIGLESIESQGYLRHGVAFSLELNRNLQEIDPLLPKIARYNEFLRDYPEELSDFRMWHYADGHRSSNYPPTAVPPEIARPGNFVFLGRLQPSAESDVDQILDDFDRLLPLYKFVEGAEAYPTASEPMIGFRFSPGCSIKPSATSASVVARQLDIVLRHNDVQAALHNLLSVRYGEEAVGTEQRSGTGSRTRIDIVLKVGIRYWFYEIKIASSARACIREALAQLLEYSFRPGAQEAERLIIIGEPPIDEEAAAFLASLRMRFAVPIYYQQFVAETATLVE
jgi:hypothetical protein